MRTSNFYLFLNMQHTYKRHYRIALFSYTHKYKQKKNAWRDLNFRYNSYGALQTDRLVELMAGKGSRVKLLGLRKEEI
jgi:hypothetical protein